MSFTLTFGQDGNCATAQVVWSVDGETYNFRSDNNFVAWISTIFTVADVLSSTGGNTNPLVLPDNTNPSGWSLNTLDNGGVGGSITMIGNAGEDQLYPSNAGTINLSAGVGGDGGSINLQGSQDSDLDNKSAGGSINLSAGNADSCPGGSITSTGSLTGNAGGGSLNMSAVVGVSGGSINTSGGGSINTTEEGGSINTSGLGGSINTYGEPGSANGGSIDTHASYGNNGGSINTSGGPYGAGGSINTSDNGGSINTSGGVDPGGSINTTNGGGSINTSNSGGSIDTTGTGSIGVGASGTRTTVNGSANSDITLTLPNATGTVPAILSSAPSITFGAVGGNGAVVASAQTITGASVGDSVLVTCTTDRATLTAGATSNIIFDGLVTATDTVSVRAHNPHANSITLGALDFRILVFKGV